MWTVWGAGLWLRQAPPPGLQLHDLGCTSFLLDPPAPPSSSSHPASAAAAAAAAAIHGWVVHWVGLGGHLPTVALPSSGNPSAAARPRSAAEPGSRPGTQGPHSCAGIEEVGPGKSDPAGDYASGQVAPVRSPCAAACQMLPGAAGPSQGWGLQAVREGPWDGAPAAGHLLEHCRGPDCPGNSLPTQAGCPSLPDHLHVLHAKHHLMTQAVQVDLPRTACSPLLPYHLYAEQWQFLSYIRL